MHKSILVKQRDISDCGAACLASVTSYYGLHLPVSWIRQMADTSKRGTSLHGLMTAAEKLKFRMKAAKSEALDLQRIPTPAIFHIVVNNGLQHFVVAYKITLQHIWFMDPASGRIRRESVDYFNSQWTGILLMLIPSEEFQCGNQKKPFSRRLMQLVHPHKRKMLKATGGALLYTLLGLSTCIYIQKIIDVVLPRANGNLLNKVSIGMIILLCFRIAGGFMKSFVVLGTGQDIDRQLIPGYCKHLLKLPQRFFDSMRTGELISRVNDAVRIRTFINDVALGIVINIVGVIVSVAVMFIYNWKLAVLCLLVIPFYLVIYWIMNSVNAKWQRKIMESGAVFENHLVETIQGVTTIRRFGVQEYFEKQTGNKFNLLMRSVFISNRNGLLLSNLSEWVTGLLAIILLWWGARLVLDRILSAGELISFFALSAFFTLPVQALIQANKPLQEAVIAADRLFEVTDLETEKNEKACVEYFPEGDLVFENVRFSYGNGNEVFNELNIRLPMRQMTAVMGESGCGKSTLLSLLQKLYAPDHGRVLIGGTDIRNLSEDMLRKEIASVPQQTDLFEGNFISNIALGEDHPDLDRITEISRRLGLDIFINQQPDKYETIIREQGINLSGGQKQRIGIARAIYRNPSVLILDEATAALDPESEKKVLQTLCWFHEQKKTIVLIAHRLSTIRYCDSIIFLKQGGEKLTGTHEKLLEETEYADLWGMVNAQRPTINAERPTPNGLM